MKDAFGTSFLLRIFIIFFVIFISFMVVAINFAKTYRVKNSVIDILERGYALDMKVTSDRISNYLKEINYEPAFNSYDLGQISSKDCIIPSELSSNDNKNKYIIGNVSGVCIIPVINGNSYHYKVTSYMVIRTSLFNFGTRIPISGETKTFNDYSD